MGQSTLIQVHRKKLMQRNYRCDSCGAMYKIKHSLEESYYEVNYCPFCGADVDDDEDDDDDSNEYE